MTLGSGPGCSGLGLQCAILHAASGVLQNSGKIFLGATCSAQGALDQDAGGQSHSAAGANLPSENEGC